MQYDYLAMDRYCVLVVGAGASKPYGLPLGHELRNLILKIRPHTVSQAHYLNELNIKPDDFVLFQQDFQTSGYSSIDAYLQTRPQWMKHGKLAIALCLVGFEGTPKLFPPYAPKDHWFEALWQKMRKPSWATLKSSRLRIITFNYDRCLELYLASVISNNYRRPYEEVMRWLNDEIVTHVHGTLGDYQVMRYFWRDPSKAQTFVDGLKNATKSIKVISEANSRAPVFLKARKLLKEAEMIAFIGFGFHRDNMLRLGISPDNLNWNNRAMLTSTRKGLTPGAWRRLCNEFIDPTYLHYSHKARTISQLIQEFMPSR